jgi:hypothetical protein
MSADTIDTPDRPSFTLDPATAQALIAATPRFLSWLQGESSDEKIKVDLLTRLISQAHKTVDNFKKPIITLFSTYLSYYAWTKSGNAYAALFAGVAAQANSTQLFKKIQDNLSAFKENYLKQLAINALSEDQLDLVEKTKSFIAPDDRLLVLFGIDNTKTDYTQITGYANRLNEMRYLFLTYFPQTADSKNHIFGATVLPNLNSPDADFHKKRDNFTIHAHSRTSTEAYQYASTAHNQCSLLVKQVNESNIQGFSEITAILDQINESMRKIRNLHNGIRNTAKKPLDKAADILLTGLFNAHIETISSIGEILDNLTDSTAEHLLIESPTTEEKTELNTKITTQTKSIKNLHRTLKNAHKSFSDRFQSDFPAIKETNPPSHYEEQTEDSFCLTAAMNMGIEQLKNSHPHVLGDLSADTVLPEYTTSQNETPQTTLRRKIVSIYKAARGGEIVFPPIENNHPLYLADRTPEGSLTNEVVECLTSPDACFVMQQALNTATTSHVENASKSAIDAVTTAMGAPKGVTSVISSLGAALTTTVYGQLVTSSLIQTLAGVIAVTDHSCREDDLAEKTVYRIKPVAARRENSPLLYLAAKRFGERQSSFTDGAGDVAVYALNKNSLKSLACTHFKSQIDLIQKIETELSEKNDNETVRAYKILLLNSIIRYTENINSLVGLYDGSLEKGHLQNSLGVEKTELEAKLALIKSDFFKNFPEEKLTFNRIYKKTNKHLLGIFKIHALETNQLPLFIKARQKISQVDSVTHEESNRSLESLMTLRNHKGKTLSDLPTIISKNLNRSLQEHLSQSDPSDLEEARLLEEELMQANSKLAEAKKTLQTISANFRKENSTQKKQAEAAVKEAQEQLNRIQPAHSEYKTNKKAKKRQAIDEWIDRTITTALAEHGSTSPSLKHAIIDQLTPIIYEFLEPGQSPKFSFVQQTIDRVSNWFGREDSAKQSLLSHITEKTNEAITNFICTQITPPSSDGGGGGNKNETDLLVSRLRYQLNASNDGLKNLNSTLFDLLVVVQDMKAFTSDIGRLEKLNLMLCIITRGIKQARLIDTSGATHDEVEEKRNALLQGVFNQVVATAALHRGLIVWHKKQITYTLKNFIYFATTNPNIRPLISQSFTDSTTFHEMSDAGRLELETNFHTQTRRISSKSRLGADSSLTKSDAWVIARNSSNQYLDSQKEQLSGEAGIARYHEATKAHLTSRGYLFFKSIQLHRNAAESQQIGCH